MKKSKMLTAVVLLVFIGLMYVGAASSTIYTNASYSITSGTQKTVSNLTAPYPNARASMSIDALTGGGTRSTKFTVYKKSGNTYILGRSATKTGMAAKQSTSVSIGYVGAGTWKITNSAVNYVGWEGTLHYVSQTP